MPKWKTLFLTDEQDAWLGRILCQRRSESRAATAGNPSDWICAVQLPAEHQGAILTAWKEVWCDQLRQQVNLTRVEQRAIDTASQDYDAAQRLSRYLTRSTPPYNAGEEEGIDNLIARFKYEYPWELQFAFLPADHDDRQYFENMRSVEELMEQMSQSQSRWRRGLKGADHGHHGRPAGLALPVTPAAERTVQDAALPAEQYPRRPRLLTSMLKHPRTTVKASGPCV